jgi:hypothetical protein
VNFGASINKQGILLHNVTSKLFQRIECEIFVQCEILNGLLKGMVDQSEFGACEFCKQAENVVC